MQDAPRGDCPEDDRCLCKRYDYISYIVNCLQYSCAGKELETAIFVGEALCRAAVGPEGFGPLTVTKALDARLDRESMYRQLLTAVTN